MLRQENCDLGVGGGLGEEGGGAGESDLIGDGLAGAVGAGGVVGILVDVAGYDGGALEHGWGGGGEEREGGEEGEVC